MLQCPAAGPMRKTLQPSYEIDGHRFSTLEAFYDEISRVLIPNAVWGRKLDAFDDILRGGFGTPAAGFVLRWRHAQISRQRLGIPRLFANCRYASNIALPPIVRAFGETLKKRGASAAPLPSTGAWTSSRITGPRDDKQRIASSFS